MHFYDAKAAERFLSTLNLHSLRCLEVALEERRKHETVVMAQAIENSMSLEEAEAIADNPSAIEAIKKIREKYMCGLAVAVKVRQSALDWWANGRKPHA